MTSKQALSKLKHDKIYSKEVINAIEEDLEVLNIIKRKNINTYKLIEVFKDYTIQDRQEEVSVEECNKILNWLKR